MATWTISASSMQNSFFLHIGWKTNSSLQLFVVAGQFERISTEGAHCGLERLSSQITQDKVSVLN